MLVNFDQMVMEFGINIKGAIHVGGHTGEEVPFYLQYTTNIHIFEPIKECFDRIPNNISKYNCALGAQECQMEMYIASNMASSSLLKPKKHLVANTHITFEERMTVPVKTLDSFNIKGCNFIDLDVQGYELEVLKGGIETMKEIDTVYTEVNTDELYENNCFLEDMDKWLENLGFKRVLLEMTSQNWGDALYKK